MDYVLVTLPSGEKVVVAERLAEAFRTILRLENDPQSILIPGSALAECKYIHPLFPNAEPSPFVAASFVKSDSGTGLVHLAPGHGVEDYNALSKLGIAPLSVVNEEGRFSDDVGIESLRGKPIEPDGSKSVLELLEQQTALLHAGVYTHKYPYDWRTGKPVVIRATKQWFADVSSIKASAVEAIKKTKMIPESSDSFCVLN
jgi:isoleucyl-tRNA synthetase